MSKSSFSKLERSRTWAGQRPPNVPSAPSLSIIIPAYNEERRLPRTLAAIAQWVAEWRQPVEVIVVENGSTDRTAAVVTEFRRTHPYVWLIEGLPAGKGGAVRTGMLAAGGARRFLCDADLSMPIGDLAKFLSPEVSGAPVLVGSREAPGARRIGEPRRRHVMGRVYNWLVRLIALPGIADSQCGFKLFTATAAEYVFPRARLAGWGFDVEVLYLARKGGFAIREIPIEWHYNADSRVRPIHDSLSMLRDLFRIRYYDCRGWYDD